MEEPIVTTSVLTSVASWLQQRLENIHDQKSPLIALLLLAIALLSSAGRAFGLFGTKVSRSP
jgi:hypothetical protein